MGLIKKYNSIFAGIGIIILFLITRIYNILALPIFTDEAIYVRWSQIAGTDANWRFISMTDGKQPLFIWISAVSMRLFSDPLLAGRLVSVVAGLATVIGLFVLTQELFKNKKISFLSSLFYMLYPFALVYDKLALYDSLVAAFIVWCLYFEILLVRRLRLDLALIFGMIAGLGMLTKTNADFALILLPFSLLLFNFKDKKWINNLGKWFIFILTSVVIANAMYAVLRLSPFFHIIGEKNNVFIYPFREWITHPFTFFVGNIHGLTGWLIDYMTVPVVLLVIVGIVVNRTFIKEKMLLLFWFVIPFVALALFGKVIYPRFIFFMTMPLLVLGAVGLNELLKRIRGRYVQVLVLLVFVSLMVIKDYFILTDFYKAPIPSADRNQLIESWPSGVGVKETVKFLEEKARTQKVYVGTEGTFGLMPYSLEIYLKDNPNIKTQGFWPINDVPPKEVTDSSKKVLTYFVFYQPCPSCKKTGLAPDTWPVEQVFQIPKIEKESYYTLYQIKPQ